MWRRVVGYLADLGFGTSAERPDFIPEEVGRFELPHPQNPSKTIEMTCSNEVRTIQRDGEPWFVLKDVCQILEMDTTQLKKVSDRLDADEKGRTQITTPGGLQETWIINESGLYNVILRSDKPEAKPFRKWVTSEVLPSIRKHGTYLKLETVARGLGFTTVAASGNEVVKWKRVEEYLRDLGFSPDVGKDSFITGNI